MRLKKRKNKQSKDIQRNWWQQGCKGKRKKLNEQNRNLNDKNT